MLVGERTIQAMAGTFTGSAGLTLPERLMAVLEGGQSAGGDKRGRQSAALLVYRTEEFPYLSLRVDEHAHPVAELRRVLKSRAINCCRLSTGCRLAKIRWAIFRRP